MVAQTSILMTTLILGSMTFAKPPADDLLAGPIIVEEEVTEQEMLSRKLQETGKSSNIHSRQLIKMWRSALMSLELTEEQQVSMESLKSEFEEAQRAFQKEYGKEMRSLRQEQNEAKKNDGTPSTESRTRMMELHELAPDVSAFQEKVWVLLSVDQHADFQVKYQALVAEEEKRKDAQKHHGRPMMDEMRDGEFGPKDSKGTDKKSKPESDTIQRHKDSVDRASLRRIRFLQRLQRLQED